MNKKRQNTNNNSDPKSKRRFFEAELNLPILKYKKDLLNLLELNQVLIVTGETGCGKSTQLPKYLYDAGYSKYGKIVCTEPRRIAAVSLANRVSEEMGAESRCKVGYAVRFDRNMDGGTRLAYVTEGVLLRELRRDGALSEYGAVIIDEAHERSVETDALLGLMKDVLRRRPEMRLVVSSATIDAEKFANYYGAAVFRIPGRVNEVQIVYSQPKSDDYITDIVDRVAKIQRKNIDGDILIFLPGTEDIHDCINRIKEKQSSLNQNLPYLDIMPAYSSLSKYQLSKIFTQTSKNARKVVVATNIAETSLTIEGIKFVIDSGFVKQKAYNSYFGIDQLLVTVISKAQADQRAGRAGRTRNGKCYRMYSSNRYHNKMMSSAVPEILRANLANTVLQLKSIGIEHVDKFDFIDSPDSNRLKEATKELVDMSALSVDNQLTVLGRYMAQLPLDPILSKILIMSSYRQCSEEMLTIVSMLCVKNIYDKPLNKINEAEKRIQQLQQHQGDHITYLFIYLQWSESNFSEEWCKANFCRYSSLKLVQNIRNQLLDIMIQCKLKIISCERQIVLVQNTLCLYYFRLNAAHKQLGNGYRTLSNDQVVYIHPTSALFRRQPEWVIFHDIMATSNKYIHEVTKMHPSFIKEFIKISP